MLISAGSPLYTKGAKVHNWKQRYFKLKDGILTYHDKDIDENPKSVIPKGSIDLMSVSLCEDDICVNLGPLWGWATSSDVLSREAPPVHRSSAGPLVPLSGRRCGRGRTAGPERPDQSVQVARQGQTECFLHHCNATPNLLYVLSFRGRAEVGGELVLGCGLAVSFSLGLNRGYLAADIGSKRFARSAMPPKFPMQSILR